VHVNGRKVTLAELGSGPPLVYLHDFIDIHSATAEWQPFHRALAERYRVIAPAFAGCAGSDEDDEIESPEDAVFSVLEMLDTLGLGSAAIVGVGIGGWIAAELAVRDRSFAERLVLVGATGLYVPNEPIADIFYYAQPNNGVENDALRRLLFASSDDELARRWVPDGRMSLDAEMLRYGMFRFATRVGFKPPYLYDRRLHRRLARYGRPALVLWGERDGLVPTAHARAYAEALPDARLSIAAGAGHSLHLERPAESALTVLEFLGS
jgi:pimeloyl-ACP methyl ester carboxylesterase